MASDIELSWAAGFFDGEGCSMFHAYGSGKYRGRYRELRLQLPQVDRRLLDRFCAAVGGKVYGPYLRPKHGRAQPIHQWHAWGDEAREIIEKLWPYLSEPKREQVTVVFEKLTRFQLKGEAA